MRGLDGLNRTQTKKWENCTAQSRTILTFLRQGVLAHANLSVLRQKKNPLPSPSRSLKLADYSAPSEILHSPYSDESDLKFSIPSSILYVKLCQMRERPRYMSGRVRRGMEMGALEWALAACVLPQFAPSLTKEKCRLSTT